jgi:hypothetical protein
MDWSSWMDTAKVIFGGAAGGIATVTFLSRYLGDKWLGHILEKEKAEYAKQLAMLTAGFSQELEHYRAQLDRSIFVSRTHFETEYTAMKEVSQCLSEVKVTFLRLHPIEAGTELIDAERTQGIASLETATSKYHEKLEEWAVFLEPALYDEFEHCYAGADAELKRLRTNSEKEPDRAGTVNYFWKSYRQASQMVRDRIKNLAVIPRT